MSAGYSRPSGFARWDWLYVTLPVLGGAPNLALIVIDPQWWRFLLAGITILGTAYCIRLWRQGVRDDRIRRAFMAKFYGRLP